MEVYGAKNISKISMTELGDDDFKDPIDTVMSKMNLASSKEVLSNIIAGLKAQKHYIFLQAYKK